MGTSTFLIPPPPSVECQHPKAGPSEAERAMNGGVTGNGYRGYWTAAGDGVRCYCSGNERRILTWTALAMGGAENGGAVMTALFKTLRPVA